MSRGTVPRVVVGPVVRGDQRGRRLGFPTANVPLGAHDDLRFGVYAGRLDGRPAAVSIGVRPTFGDGLEPLLEAHVLDFEGDLYGDTVTVEVGRFLRPERRFEDTRELVAQMHRDVAAVRTMLESPDRGDAEPAVLRAIDALRRGRMVVLTGGTGREAEADLVVAADATDAEAINFMAREARGLICLALTPERCDALQLPMMRSPEPGVEPRGFTVSIEARHGVSTGISAADRARTVAAAVAADATAADVVAPGHMFPVRTAAGGVCAVPGHAEAAVELARRAGRAPAAVSCTVMDATGEALPPAAVQEYAASRGLVCVSAAAVERYVRTGGGACDCLDRRSEVTPYGIVETFRYAADAAGHEIVVAVVGDPRVGPAVPVVLQDHDLRCDVLGLGGDGTPRGAAALHLLSQAGGGMLIHLDAGGTPETRWTPGARAHVDASRLARVLRSLGAAHVRPLDGSGETLQTLLPFGVTVDVPTPDA